MQFAASGFSFKTGGSQSMQAASRRELALVAEAGDLEVFERIDVAIAVAVTAGAIRAARTVGAAAGAGLAVL